MSPMPAGKTSYFHLTLLYNEIGKSIAIAVVQSRLEYANSSLCKTSSNNISKLQQIQDTAARFVFRDRYSHDSLSQLQWFSISKRKTNLQTHKHPTANLSQISNINCKTLHTKLQIHNPAYQTPTFELHQLHQQSFRTAIDQHAGKCIDIVIEYNM
jgi:hypothetical protein